MFLCVAWITDYSRSLRAASAAGPPGDDLSQSRGTNSPSPLEDPRIATNRCLDARAKRRHEPTPMPEPPEPTRLAEPAWLATYPMSCLRAPRSRPRADPLQNQGVDRASVYRRTATPSTAPSRGAGVERRAGLLANEQDRIDTGQRIGKVADRSRAQQAVRQLLDSFGHRVDEAALPPRGAPALREREETIAAPYAPVRAPATCGRRPMWVRGHRSEQNMLTRGVRERVDGTRRRCRDGVVVNAHLAQVTLEPPLEEGARRGVEHTARRPQHLMHPRRASLPASRAPAGDSLAARTYWGGDRAMPAAAPTREVLKLCAPSTEQCPKDLSCT